MAPYLFWNNVSIILELFQTISQRQLALFVFSDKKLTTQLSICCIAFCGKVYPLTMALSPGQLMTRAKNNF